MPNRVTQLASRQRAEVIRIDEQALDIVARTYLALYDNLRGDVDALMLAIERMDAPTIAAVKRLPQYVRLTRRAQSELEDFTIYLERTIDTVALSSIGLGLDHSRELVRSMTRVRFDGLQPSAMRPLLGYLAKDGPLYERLSLLTGSTVDKVISTIADGVSLGYNPRKIASQIQDSFGGGLTDALRNTRTVQLYSYRDSARANYMATGGIVTGWIWYAELDTDTCLSCVAQHGSEHDLSETLNDHYNGRCAALPLIEEFGNPVETSGEDWFNSLSESEQRAMMGESKHAAWSAGKFEFSRLSAEQDNEVYGVMRTEASLASLIGE